MGHDVTFGFMFPGVLGSEPGHLSPAGGDSAAWANQLRSIDSALAAAPEKARAFATRFGMPDSASAHQLPDLLQFYEVIADELVRHVGGNPFDNRGTIYGGFPDDAALNRGVPRVAADPKAVAYLARYYTPTGRITTPVLTVHATGDQIVPSWVENDYAATVAAAGTERWLVAQYVVAANHCEFTQAQIGDAFDELRTWVREGRRPTGALLVGPRGQ